MSSFIEEVKAKAAADRKTIVLPESNDKRTYEAIEMIKKENFADLVLVATPEDVEKYGAGYDLSGVTVVDPVNGPKVEEYAEKFAELRKSKGMTYEQALAILKKDYTYYGVMMVKMGDADDGRYPASLPADPEDGPRREDRFLVLPDDRSELPLRRERHPGLRRLRSGAEPDPGRAVYHRGLQRRHL